MPSFPFMLSADRRVAERGEPCKTPHRSWAHRWRGESAPGTALRTAHRPGCYPPPLRVPDTVHGRHHHSRRSAPFRRHFSATRWSSGAHGFEAALEEPARCSFSPAIHPALQCPGPAKRPPCFSSRLALRRLVVLAGSTTIDKEFTDDFKDVNGTALARCAFTRSTISCESM